MRRFISRFLLVVLAGVAVYALIRLASEENTPGVLVSMGDSISPDRLRHRAFEVEAPVRLALHAVGSFETESVLGATAWIVQRDSETVVWTLDDHATRGRGTLAAADDTLRFDPGTYDLFFASFGDPDVREETLQGDGFLDRLGGFLSRGGRAWHGDADRWRFHVAFTDPSERDHARALRGDDLDRIWEPAEGPGVVWSTGVVGHRKARSYAFEVSAPTEVRITAGSEIDDGVLRDDAALLTLATADIVWAMRAENTRPAGGSARNRYADTTLTLAPGLYRVTYTTDENRASRQDTNTPLITFTTADSHRSRRWVANPPLLPARWGLTLKTDPAVADQVAALDPWQRLPRIASFTCVGEDALREETFALPDTTFTLLSATGEFVGSTGYDYAVLLREQDGRAPEEVWTMERDATVEAGGADKNRLAEATLRLDPGTYTLRYISDGSHDCSEFNSDEPDFPDRWGATLFALDPSYDLNRVTRVAAPTGPDAPDVNGEVLVRFDRVPNDSEREAEFTLSASTSLRVYAIGEILPSGSYDYAWIEDDDGETVWEMTRANTRWAGGSKKNRRYDGTVTLPPGRYTAFYQTDDAHAYGDWDQGPPTDPAAWGLTIWKPVADTPAPPLPPPSPESVPQPPAAPAPEVQT